MILKYGNRRELPFPDGKKPKKSVMIELAKKERERQEEKERESQRMNALMEERAAADRSSAASENDNEGLSFDSREEHQGLLPGDVVLHSSSGSQNGDSEDDCVSAGDEGEQAQDDLKDKDKLGPMV